MPFLPLVVPAALLVLAGTSAVRSPESPVHGPLPDPDGCAALRSALAGHGLASTIRLDGIALGDSAPIDLELKPAPVTTPATRFVLGAGGRSFAYDRARVRALRGGVPGEPESRAFMLATPSATLGYVDSHGARRWIRSGDRGETGSLEGPLAPPPGVPLCGDGTVAAESRRGPRRPALKSAAGAPAPQPVRVVQLAVETDYELFSLFGDVQAATDHVVAVYSAVSDILERDVGVRLELTFVRIWDTPDDLFNEPNPLSPFQDFWNSEMGDVPRDVAQYFSGRRDLPWGGVAYVGALCGSSAYSVVGYAVGLIPDLDAPSVYHFDVPICAHELGHNLGSYHTHDYGLDNCFQLDNTPQRGTIMSYCSQTVSGGNAVFDLRVDTYCAGEMHQYLAGVPCIVDDCDGDGGDDAAQIAADAGLDSNGNGLLDACEDCDGDGTLDPAEIAAGSQQDADADGIPDGCEPDCNRNGTPDSLDIALGRSSDLWLDGVPDECEADCDGDGQSDYSQIQADLALDLDRNLLLDGCEDCDGDGTIDLEERDGAWDAWIANHHTDGAIRELHAVAGTLVRVSQPGAVDAANDVIITPDRRILVSSGGDDRIVEFAADGTLVGTLVAAGLGGLDTPAGLLLDGNSLLVASRGSNAVLRYSLAGGGFLGAFVAPGSGGLTAPFGLARGPDGDLFVNAASNSVRRYDGVTGAFKGVFVGGLGNGGLSDPRGMLFLPDGRLVVAGRLNNAILSYSGTTGGFLGKFNNGGTSSALTFDQPWGLRVGPNGNLFAVRHFPGNPTGEAGGLLHDDIAELHVNASRVYEFHISSGNFIRSYVTGHDTGLWAPTGIDFLPGASTDCNRNGIFDGCDIATGRSGDLNGNGVPDDCEGISPDLDGDGSVGGGDLGILLAAWGLCPVQAPCPADLTGDGVVDGADLGALLAAWGD